MCEKFSHFLYTRSAIPKSELFTWKDIGCIWNESYGRVDRACTQQ